LVVRQYDKESGMATLTVWRFDTPDGADDAVATVELLTRQDLITVHDGATVAWRPDARKPRTRQLHTLTGADALGGMFWGMLFGLVFFVPLLDAAAAETGIDSRFIERVRASVTPGTSALFLLTSNAVTDRVRDIVIGDVTGDVTGDRELLRTQLPAEREAALRQAFAA
jgi:uncharacterized membrane protein